MDLTLSKPHRWKEHFCLSEVFSADMYHFVSLYNVDFSLINWVIAVWVISLNWKGMWSRGSVFKTYLKICWWSVLLTCVYPVGSMILWNNSQHYNRFKSYCCEAYNILRKSSNLILNLFHLMAGANIPDIASDPEKGILKVRHSFSSKIHHDQSKIYMYLLMELTFTYKKNANHTEPGKLCSFKRSFGWTWMMRRLCSSSSLWLLTAWMHCFLKWWRQYIAGPNTGVRKVSRSGRAAISIDWTVVRYTSCLWLQVVTQLFEVTMGSSSCSVLWVQNLIIWNLVNLCVC